mmetsp:Transcript_14171/g.21630  ORF Transcript_14171/g.21630 Transcript_14171/m.21630 type:complete len:221 (+) Transcript_14171:1749-2411(+)
MPRLRILTYLSAAPKIAGSMQSLPIKALRSCWLKPPKAIPNPMPTKSASCKAVISVFIVFSLPFLLFSPAVLSFSDALAIKFVVAVYINATTRAPLSVTLTAGLKAACCAVPDSKPTAEVSIMDKRGLQSHTPIAGMANWMILEIEGASILLVDVDSTFEVVTFSKLVSRSGSSTLPSIILLTTLPSSSTEAKEIILSVSGYSPINSWFSSEKLDKLVDF